MTAALDRLVARGVVRHGSYLDDAPGAEQYVHVAVLDEIQRRQVHARRLPRAVATAEQFSAFLLRRHHLHPEHRLVGPPGVLAALELLQGDDVPLRVWEHDLLSARVEDYRREWLDRLGLGRRDRVDGVRAAGRRAGSGRARRGGARATTSAGCGRAPSAPRWTRRPRTCSCICSCAAPRSRVISPGRRVSIRPRRWPRYGSCSGPAWRPPTRSAPSWLPARAAGRRGARGTAPAPPAPRPGAWRPGASAAGRTLERDRRGRAAVTRGARRGAGESLLARYGVVARELARGDWATLRHTLLRMEYGGDVVRGYFVEGLSGRAVRAGGRARRSGRAAHAPGRASRAGESRRPGESLGTGLAAGASGTAPGLSVARLPHAWLLFRAGRPLLLAEGYGRELTPLAGFEPVDDLPAWCARCKR